MRAAVALLALAVVLALAACGSPGKGAAAPAAPPPAPTRAECERVVAHLAQALPGHFPGEAADVDDCLALPRDVVVCLERVTTIEQADACVDAHCRGAGCAWAPRPSPSECERAVDRLVALRGSTLDASRRAGLVADCRVAAARADVLCTAAASGLTALDACHAPR